MRKVRDTKVVVLTQPGAIVDNNSLTTKALDLRGYSRATIYVVLGATDIALTALKVQESDTISDANTLSSGADVEGLVYGTSTDVDGDTVSLPGATDDNKVYVFDVTASVGRKRYLDVTATVGDGTSGAYVMIFAVLEGGRDRPNTATKRGLGANLSV